MRKCRRQEAVLTPRNLDTPHVPILPGFPRANRPISCLNENKVSALTQMFEHWYESTTKPHVRRARGRYRLVYLVLRFTWPRIGEVLLLHETRNMDFHRGKIVAARFYEIWADATQCAASPEMG
jgi:hypothetical protein